MSELGRVESFQTHFQIVSPSGKVSVPLHAGQTNVFKAKSGEHYRILKGKVDEDQLLENVVAKRSGKNLELQYVDGTQLTLENYYQECTNGGCDLTLPGLTAEGHQIKANSSGGVALDDGSTMVYAHGNHSLLMEMAQGSKAIQTVFSNIKGSEFSYAPGAFELSGSNLALIGGGLALLGVGGGSRSSGGSGGSAQNLVTGTVVAGPVVAGNGLTVNIYKADGTTLLGSQTLSSSGGFSIDVGSYTGALICKLVDSGPGGDFIDEATGRVRDINANLMAVGVVGSGSTMVNINALTTIAALKAGAVFAGSSVGVITSTLIIQSNAAVASVFGLQDLIGINVVTTVDTNGVTNVDFTPAALSSAEKYGAVLAALSGMDTANGGDMQATIDLLVSGITLAGNTATLSSASIDAVLSGAVTAAANSPGSGSNSLTAIISDVTAVTSTAVSINQIATDALISGGEQNVTINGTTIAGAIVNLSFGGNTRTATVNGTTWSYVLTVADISAMGQGSEIITAKATLIDGGVATATRNVVVDTLWPVVSNVEITSATGVQNQTLNTGDVVRITVTMGESVTITGTPQLNLMIGGSTVVAAYTSGSGTPFIEFSYTVLSSQTDEDGISITANSLTLNSGTLSDAAGNAATLTHSAVLDNISYRVDTLAPAAAVVGAVAIDDVINISERAGTVTVSGTNELGAAVTVNGNAAAVVGTNWSYVLSATAIDAFGQGGETLTVISTDVAGNSTSATRVVTVDTLAPLLSSPGAATAVNENSGANKVIYLANASDAGAIVYSLKPSTGDFSALTIQDSSGAVTLKDDPNFEAQSVYSFTVVATDAVGNSSEQAVSLAINNLDEVAPTITSSALATSINENSGDGQIVYTAISTDTGDVSGGVSFSIKTSTDDASSFIINSNTGAVSLVDNPNFEVKSNYSFTVIAADVAGNMSERAVSLSVNNINDAPTAVGSIIRPTAVVNLPFSLSLQEYFSDTDATGLMGTLSYAVTFGNLPAGLSLNLNTGVLSGTVSSIVSAETISVTATDGGGLSAIQTFTLGVTTAPVIQSFVVTDLVGTTTVGKQGDALTFTVLLSQAVDITGGTPTIVFSTGGQAVTATYQSGTGTNQMVFTGTAPSGNGTFSLTSIALNGSTVTGRSSAEPWVVTSVGQAYSGYSLDNTATTLAISSNEAAVKAGETATITFTFSESPVGFADGDITTTGGTLGSISGSGLTRTATFTPTAGTPSGSASITVTSGAYADAAGNNGGAGSTPSISIDTLAPTLTVSNVDISTDTGSSASDFVTNNASQTVTGILSGALAAGDVLYGSVNNGSSWLNITNQVSGTAISWNGAVLSGSSNIVFKVVDAAGNTGTNIGSTAYVLDTTAPTGLQLSLSDAIDFNGAVNTDYPTISADLTPTIYTSSNIEAGLSVSVDWDNSGGYQYLGVTNSVFNGVTLGSAYSTNGEKNIRIKTVDAAGNETISSLDISVMAPSSSGGYVNGLLWGTTVHEVQASTVTTISYHFNGILESSGNGGSIGYSWTDIEKTAFRTALSLWASVANINFVEVDSRTSADFVFNLANAIAMTSNSGVSAGMMIPPIPGDVPNETVMNSEGWGYFNWEAANWGDTPSASGIQPGSYNFITIVHEIGHGLGLAHPHDRGGISSIYPGVSSAYNAGNNGLNDGIYSLMSYMDESGAWTANSATVNGFQLGPMAFDIAAIQYLYGANNSTNSGVNNYAINNALSGDGVSWQTIWDTGGVDTISYSGSYFANIDLRSVPISGGFDGTSSIYKSYLPGAVGGFLIADGVVIENATGGSGNDLITGNASANVLSGGLGNDTLYGLGGNDTLNGGGGGGTDWANYVYSVAAVNVSLVTNEASGGEGIDTLISIENIAGSTLADTLFGDSNANWIRGNLGNDTINGGGGFDYADYAFALAGVTVNLSALTATGDGSDTLVSIENVSGSGFGDTLLGDGGSNILSGGGGNDLMFGGAGLDYLIGGAGYDTFVVSFGSGSVLLANADVINDYNDTFDSIGLTGGITTANIFVTQNGLNTVISTSSEYLAILMNTSAWSITSSDFRQV